MQHYTSKNAVNGLYWREHWVDFTQYPHACVQKGFLSFAILCDPVCQTSVCGHQNQSLFCPVSILPDAIPDIKNKEQRQG